MTLPRIGLFGRARLSPLGLLGIPLDTESDKSPSVTFRYTGKTGSAVEGDLYATWEKWHGYDKSTLNGPVCEITITDLSKAVLGSDSMSGYVEGVVSRKPGYENWETDQVKTDERSTASCSTGKEIAR